MASSFPVLGPLLRPARAVGEMAPARLAALLESLERECVAAGGIGLAANQVGLDLALALVWPRGTARPIALIDPVILAAGGAQVRSEGCLSIPGLRGVVERPEALVVATRTLEGGEAVLELEGESARIASHETDHLAGRLFISRLADPLLDSLVPG